VALEVASDYPEITADEMLVDTCAMELVRAPGQFDVIVTTNLFGDILSDEASMLVGGLGVAYSGNIGVKAAVFEPVHGSAPTLAGKHTANPVATFLSAVMLLQYIGETAVAGRLRQAVLDCIAQQAVTPDLGGTLTTEQVTDRVLSAFEIVPERK
jgi:isocitrate/isopropylmalate dehydrogenase